MTDENIIQKYITEHIPISKAIGIKLELISDDEVIISAPFLNNVNHKMTVFGGSLHAVATLACWSLVYKNLIDILGKIEIVISHSEVDYLVPVDNDFKAICKKPDIAIWEHFNKILNKKRKSRIILNAKIFQGDNVAVNYKGTFVVLKKL